MSEPCNECGNPLLDGELSICDNCRHEMTLDDVENDNYCVFCGDEWESTDSGKKCGNCGYDEAYERSKGRFEEY